MDRDELIAQFREALEPFDVQIDDGLHDNTRYADYYSVYFTIGDIRRVKAILAALESRSAPTEVRAQAVLERNMEGHFPTRAEIVRAMIEFATDTTPSAAQTKRCGIM